MPLPLLFDPEIPNSPALLRLTMPRKPGGRMWKWSLLGLAASGVVSAQSVTTTEMHGQPLVYLKDGRTSGCGLRIIGGTPEPGGKQYRMFDTSVNLWSSGLGVVKGVSYDTSLSAIAAGTKPKRAYVEAVWIKADGAKATVPLEGSLRRADDGVSQLYSTSTESVLDALDAQQHGKPLL